MSDICNNNDHCRFSESLEKEAEHRRKADSENSAKIDKVLEKLNEAKNQTPKGIAELQKHFVIVLLSVSSLFSVAMWNINSNINKRVGDFDKRLEDFVGGINSRITDLNDDIAEHTGLVGHAGVLENLSGMETQLKSHDERIKLTEAKVSRVRTNLVGYTSSILEKIRAIERDLFSREYQLHDINKRLERDATAREWWNEPK